MSTFQRAWNCRQANNFGRDLQKEISPGRARRNPLLSILVIVCMTITTNGEMSIASNEESEALYRQGMQFLNEKNYQQAENHFRLAFDKSDKSTSAVVGKQTEALRVLFGFVFLYRAKNDLVEEEKVLKKGIALAKDLNDESQEAMFIWNLTNLLKKQKRYAEMEPLLRRKLELSEKHYQDSNNLQPLFELANNLASQHKYVEAEDMFRKTLNLAEKCESAPGELAKIQDAYATVLKETGRTNEAKQLKLNASKLNLRGIHYNIVIAKVNIRKGETISSTSLEETSYFLPEGAQGCPPYGFIEKKEAGVGKHAKYAISKGSTITSFMYE